MGWEDKHEKISLAHNGINIADGRCPETPVVARQPSYDTMPQSLEDKRKYMNKYRQDVRRYLFVGAKARAKKFKLGI